MHTHTVPGIYDGHLRLHTATQAYYTQVRSTKKEHKMGTEKVC